MLDDVRPPAPRRKPKQIEPLEKPATKSIHELAAAEDGWALAPEQAVVASKAATPLQPEATIALEAADAKSKKNLVQRLHLSWPPTGKQRIIYSALAIVVAFGIGAGWTLTHHKRAVVAETTPKKVTHKATATPIYSTLSGLPVSDASVNKRTVTGVMVENSLDARPQSGLSNAGVVFEAVAEGGVTRFMALYQDTVPSNVGPIRSARPYYVQWALGFGAAYAHVGGSPDALQDITTWGVQDMNQFYNSNYYHRTTDREAPHNVYTGIDTLNQLEATKGYTSTYNGFQRVSKEAPAATPTASSIDFGLSGPTYDPHYDYNKTTNSYDRSEAGQAQTDANTGKQLSPKVVIAIVVPLAQGALDSSGAYYSDYNVIGSGQAYIFQNGTLTTANWNKANNTDQITFTDASGNPVPLNRGQTWISAVSAANKVTYR